MKHPWIDAHEITTCLWQGSLPIRGLVLKSANFQSLVICAKELEGAVGNYPEVRVFFAPNVDLPGQPLAKVDFDVALEAARTVVAELHAGRRVLVCCTAGLNRSGLVNALSLHLLYGWSGAKCVKHVRSARTLKDKTALYNPEFVKALRQLPGKDNDPPSPNWLKTAAGLLIPKK